MLGIYVHFPFCRVHCSYCAFAVSTNDAMQDRYFDALKREIEKCGAPALAGDRGLKPAHHTEAVDSIYFGGGTPSRTQTSHLAAIAEAIRSRFDVEADAEFSMESNPEDVTDVAVDAWRTIGVNRLSIGVQSFHDNELRPLGRIHGGELAANAVKTAVASGIRTSLDLILGLPGQTEASFHETLDTAIDLGAGHISIYMLDLEQGSVLEEQVHHGRVELPDDDLVARLYVDAIARLREAGFEQYEISNFARPGEESRHNLHYWRREPYYGFGLGAHSFLGDRRFANTRDLARYVEAPGEAEFTEELSEAEEKRETIFLRLRQPAGLEYGEVVRLCGQEGIEWIEQGMREGWLRREGERVAFTPSGFLLSTDLISQLF